MTAAGYAALVERHAAPLLDESGAALYSGARTLRDGDLYVLGFNPGGAEGPTVRESLDRLTTDPDRNEYEEDWGNGDGPGGHPLQKRLRWLLEALGHDVGDVCASNLVFARSPGAAGVGYPATADLCWPVHEAVLRAVRPHTLLVFGDGEARSTYSYVRRALAPVYDEARCHSHHGSWECKSFRARHDGRDLLVVGLPHLSRYDVTTKADVVEWVRSRTGAA